MWRRLKRLSTLQIALLVSAAVHAVLLTLRLADPEGFQRILQDTPLEVVLVNAGNSTAPPKAQVIAQRDLAGGGDADSGHATSPLPPSPTAQTGDAAEDTQRQIEQKQVQQMELLAQIRRELAKLPQPDPARESGAVARHADEERRRQLLNLLAEIDRRIQEENARPRRRYVSPAAREGVHAIYYDELRRRIEDTGTRNFPENNGQRLYGELIVQVAVDAQGRVVEVELVRSSGNPALDRRALAIVRSAAPYGRFSAAMKAQFDQLVFVSRFRFTRDEGLRAAVEDTGSRERRP
ncbi:protein TonB [Sphaerotilus hippei]|uniref:Protein TonB n=1 Tax=Sphaerotilus hippei TaxID=744406 RepID=A0A318H7P7_9BURK|nr:TonB family protein [Sphaerotilus hippei]PXW93867.1 protein TonB [Sphaerotilus hippei]